MTAAVRGPGDRHGVGVQVKATLIDELADETPQVRNLRVEIGKIRLAPGGAEAARGVA
jgi:hypothetical protein